MSEGASQTTLAPGTTIPFPAPTPEQEAFLAEMLRQMDAAIIRPGDPRMETLIR